MVYFLFFCSFILGLMVGSFINCLIWRLYQKESMWPSIFGGKGETRSYCPKCRNTIAWYDNIPVISFLLLKFKCRHCKKPISWQYPIVEVVTAVLFALAFYVNLGNYYYISLDWVFLLTLIRDWFVIFIMVIIFIYDLRWYLILDVVTLPACVVVLVLNLLLQNNWKNLLISGIIGGSFFLFQFVVSRGRWIGGGDIRLGLLMGFILGWPNVLLAIFMAYIMGSVIGVGLILFGKKKWGSEIPFGMFLSVTTVITLFWGSNILFWYLNLFY